jgi:hypothetical protein
MKKWYGKYGKWVRLAGFLVVFFCINKFLTINLITSSVTRCIVHDFFEPDNEEESFDCVFLGQSHTTYGIDTEVISEETGMTVGNAAIGGEYARDMYYMALEMYSHYTPKVVVLDVDFGYFINVPDTDNTTVSTLVYNYYPASFRKLSYAFSTLPQKEFRAALFPWMNSRDNFTCMNGIFWSKRTDAYKNYEAEGIVSIDACDTYKGNGFLYRDRTYEVDKSENLGIWWNEPKVDNTTSPAYFKKLVELCRSKGSEVVMISSPMNYQTMTRQDSYEEYGQAAEYFNKLARDNNLTYYNFNLVKNTVYARKSTDYWDGDGHMFGDAAEQWSSFLGKFLKKLESGEDIQLSDYLYSDIYELMDAEVNTVK